VSTYTLQSHNVSSGMEDYKMDTPTQALNAAARLFESLSTLVKALTFDEKRALEEVNQEYSTTTELADTLQRVADVPFRVGHHFASELVNFGRARNLRPSEIPFQEAQRIYAESARHFQQLESRLPLTEAEFRRSLTPENMVQSAQGLGGPQPSEVERMLVLERERLLNDRRWLVERRAALQRADNARHAAFDAMRSGR
jgi:argininosuccinate lyase